MATDVKAPRRSLREDAINLPNLLTMLRVVLIPVVLWLMWDATPKSNFYAASVYVLCTVTDFFDGYLARRMKLISILGQFLDPLADKLLVMSTLVFMTYQGRLPLLGVMAVILMEARELSITSPRDRDGRGRVDARPAGRQGEGGAPDGRDSPPDAAPHLRSAALRHRLVPLRHEPGRPRAPLPEHASLLLSGADYIRLFAEAVEAKERRLAEARGQGGTGG